MPPEERAFLDAIAAEPDDAVHRLVYADWLEEQGRLESARLARVSAELLSVPLAWDRDVDWQKVKELIRHCHDRCRKTTSLGLVRLHRALRAKYPVPWEKINMWPNGWSSERCRDSIDATLAAIEQATLTGTDVAKEVQSGAYSTTRSANLASADSVATDSAEVAAAALAASFAASAHYSADVAFAASATYSADAASAALAAYSAETAATSAAWSLFSWLKQGEP